MQLTALLWQVRFYGMINGNTLPPVSSKINQCNAEFPQYRYSPDTGCGVRLHLTELPWCKLFHRDVYAEWDFGLMFSSNTAVLSHVFHCL